ncbi:MAG: hypothetical protein ACRDU8_03020, partial [Egibacteraceae bacterium]
MDTEPADPGGNGQPDAGGNRQADAGRFTIDTLLALPRLSGLALSPDGTWLVTSVARLDREGKKFASALWALNTSDQTAPRRLTRSSLGESSPAFLPDGSLLFTSGRLDPDAPKDDPRKDAPALWLLPAGGGEGYLVAGPPGGVNGFAVARDAGTVVFGALVHPDTDAGAADAARDGGAADAARDGGAADAARDG